MAYGIPGFKITVTRNGSPVRVKSGSVTREARKEMTSLLLIPLIFMCQNEKYNMILFKDKYLDRIKSLLQSQYGKNNPRKKSLVHKAQKAT